MTLRREQRGVLVAMAGVGSFFWVLLWTGFRLHGQPPPAPIAQGIVPAALIFIATLVLGVRWLWRRREAVADAFTLPDVSINLRGDAERRRWLAALAADPRRRRYAARIEAGDSFWTPDRIEYDLDSNATTCCAHLAPIESALRASGVVVLMSGAGIAVAHCRIDTAALSARFELPASVAYEEMHIPDRSIHDPPDARMYCAACQSSIWVKHPDVAPPATPVFPNYSGR